MPTVLIVDDALFMRVAVGNMFKEWGFDIVGEASNGREAVELYDKYKPDLVTMDITMPGMSGLDAVKEIIPAHPAANIIMMTALGQQRIIVEAIEAGAKDFITKPFEKNQLKTVVNNILGYEEL
ncbi:response regulator [Lysinibacillus sp. SGAir0095]|uniref:response regulator n=1 Tax=Lysinibacillus sp. SGAir0095 TaxID=2070463 RepID=UPI0010CCDC2A|nr:response regulator [Lysinibacillus sp. SGAir0095]QCR32625.1 two-component system response regulator [Lysinibacillus sp. SGAir0095]